uniref:glycosyltransferase family 4 protein n=1 Tax=Flavobacterium sp. TaxID=239 RepID=UPI00404AC731
MDFNIFFSPLLFYKLIKEQKIDLIIAHNWNDLNVILISFLKKTGVFKGNLHFWTEANYLTTGSRNDNFIKKYIRKFVYNHNSSIQLISGKMTDITLKRWGISNYISVPLPNSIEESKYVTPKNLFEKRKLNTKPIILIPARLIEKIKGQVNFFLSLERSDFDKCTFVLAGDGESKFLLEDFISKNSLEENILLKGDCTTSEMCELYAKANAVLLPSYTDASPLCLIEAIRMKLPLLVSERCGNHFEVLTEGKNGYLFNPEIPSTMRNSFRKFISRDQDWENMGKISSDIYETVFSKNNILDNFINSYNNIN